GWVRLQQSNHRWPTYRMRALLARKDVNDLVKIADNVTDGLRPFFGQNRGGADPEFEVAKGLYAAIVSASGYRKDFEGLQRAYLEGGPKDARLVEKVDKEVEKLVREIKEGRVLTLRSHSKIKMRASLPVRQDGLLGMPLQEVLALRGLGLVRKFNDLTHK